MPHVLVHGIQASHSVHLQFTGHLQVLHGSVFMVGPTQSLPPFLAGIFLRSLVFPPLPQVFEQVPNFAHSPHLQSFGQVKSLQDFVFVTAPWHAFPPWPGPTLSRTRIRIPLFLFGIVHVVLQGPQAPHGMK